MGEESWQAFSDRVAWDARFHAICDIAARPDPAELALERRRNRGRYRLRAGAGKTGSYADHRKIYIGQRGNRQHRVGHRSCQQKRTAQQ